MAAMKSVESAFVTMALVTRASPARSEAFVLDGMNRIETGLFYGRGQIQIHPAISQMPKEFQAAQLQIIHAATIRTSLR
jgi:hypothetical protein